MKIIQLNLNHCAAAQDLLSQSIIEMDLDIAIVCEQYKNLYSSVWEKDKTGKAAIWSCGKYAFQDSMKTPDEGFVRTKIGGIYFYSCYVSPNIPLNEYELFIDRLVEDAAKYNPKIIAGDFNERQFGFRKARSTIDAINTVISMAKTAIYGKGMNKKYCAIITLDIKNTCNSAGWNQIMQPIKNLEVP